MPPPPPEGMGWPGVAGRRTFNRLLADAIADMATHGYVSPERVDEWLRLLRNAAEHEVGREGDIDEMVRRGLGSTFKRLVDDGKVANYVPGVTRFNVSMVKPKLRAELDRRILASADLIKLHRREAVERTLQRFQGWSTSIPPGGDAALDKREIRTSIGKSLAQFKYERRRVDVDQGHKLLANISEIVATDAGAIAGIWHSHGEHDAGYSSRKEHLARAEKVFLVRDSWAAQQGLVKPAGHQYIDEIERPGQFVFCRCWYTWITSLRRLPEEMWTQKGRDWIERGRLAVQQRMAA
jgi:hypothetical protein